MSTVQVGLIVYVVEVMALLTSALLDPIMRSNATRMAIFIVGWSVFPIVGLLGQLRLSGNDGVDVLVPLLVTAPPAFLIVTRGRPSRLLPASAPEAPARPRSWPGRGWWMFAALYFVFFIVWVVLTTGG